MEQRHLFAGTQHCANGCTIYFAPLGAQFIVGHFGFYANRRSAKGKYAVAAQVRECNELPLSSLRAEMYLVQQSDHFPLP